MGHIRVIIFFAIFLCIASSNSEMLIDNTHEDHIPLAEFALLVTRRYISSKSNALVIKEGCINCDRVTQDFHYHLLSFYLKNLNGIMTFELYYGHHVDNPWDYYIFVVNNLLTFTHFPFSFDRYNVLLLLFNDSWYNPLLADITSFCPIALFAETTYDREFYLTIILVHNSNDRGMRKKIMLELFEKCIYFKVLHVVIITQEVESNGSIASCIYSYTGGYCDKKIVIVKTNQYKNGKLENDYLFPPYFSNFNKCILKISAHVLRPLLDFHGERNDPAHLTDAKRLTGVEGSLLAILARYFNFTIYLNFPLERSELNASGNSSGCFAELEADTAKIAIGAFSGTYPGRTKFSTSVVYYQIPEIFAIRTGLKFGPLKQLAGPFCYGTWLIVSISFLMSCIAIKLIRSCGNLKLQAIVLGPHNNYPYTNLLTIFLGNPIVRIPRRNFARFLLMSWLLLTLILRNAYQGQMFDSLRVSRRISLPKKISGLLRRDYNLLSSVYVDYYPRNKTIVMDNITTRALITESKEGLYTFIALQDTVNWYNFQFRNSSNLTIVPEPIRMHHLVMYFKKHSVLKYIFDPKIKRLMNFGIISYFAKKNAMRSYQTLNTGLRRLPRISNDMLQGLYVLYGTLMGISSLCFILELLTRRMNRIKTIFDSAHR